MEPDLMALFTAPRSKRNPQSIDLIHNDDPDCWHPLVTWMHAMPSGAWGWTCTECGVMRTTEGELIGPLSW